MPGQIKIDDGSGNYTVLTNGGSLGSDKTITVPNTTGTMALTSDISAGGLTEADEWLLTANHTGDGVITNTYARGDWNAGYLGSGMSVSSGVFTFPTTGYYLIIVVAEGKIQSADYNLYLDITDDNFSSIDRAARMSMYDSSGTNYLNMGTNVIFDVTDTTQSKCRLYTSNSSSGATIYGSSGQKRTALTFIKLGDT